MWVGENSNDVPEYSYQEKSEVETDGDLLEFFLPQLDLPVIQQRQAEKEAGESSSQVTRVPGCRQNWSDPCGEMWWWNDYLRSAGLDRIVVVTVHGGADVVDGDNHNESQADESVSLIRLIIKTIEMR